MEIITKSLKGFTGTAWLVKLNKKVSLKDCEGNEKFKTEYFVVSGTNVPFIGGWEVLVFPADKSGNVLEFGEVAGGKGMSHEEAIEALISKYGD